MWARTLGQLHVPRDIDGTVLREDVRRSGPIGADVEHSHVELEAHLIVRGHCTFILAGSRFRADAGTLVWVPPGIDHLVFDVDDALVRWMLLARTRVVRKVLGVDAARGLLGSDSVGRLARRLTTARARELARICSEAADTGFSLRPAYNAGVAFTLVRWWAAFSDARQTPVSHELHPSVARAVQLLQRENPPPGLRNLATRCGVSPAHLSRLFAREVGMSITEFRNRERIDRFCRLYDGGRETTATAAALDAGFGSYAQFYRVLRETLGVTPAELSRRWAR